MEEPTIRLELYKFLGEEEGYSSTPEVITSWVNGNSNVTLDVSKDTLSFKFLNNNKFGTWDSLITANNISENKFRFNDNIRLFAWYGNKPNNLFDYLIIDVLVKQIDVKTSQAQSEISIKTANRTEEILRSYDIYVSRKDDDTISIKQANTIIKELIRKANSRNKKSRFHISAYLDNETNPDTGSPGSIVSTKSDGTAFPTIDYSKSTIRVYEHIKELSDPKYTDDEEAGTYLYYIKNTPTTNTKFTSLYGPYVNELVWKYKSISVSDTLEENKDLFGINMSYRIGDVINHYIIYAGKDCDSAGIHTFEVNTESAGKYGRKSKYYNSYQNNAMVIIQNELNSGNIKNGYSANDVDSDFSLYPAAVIAGSTWNFTFRDRDETTGVSTGTIATASSKSEYNNKIRTEIKWQVREKVRKILQRSGEPSYNVKAMLELGNTKINGQQLVPGDIYKLIIPSVGWTSNNPYYLRLRNIRHNFSPTSWKTTIEFKEDDKINSEKLNKAK